MKKYIALFLSLIMILSLAACGGSGDKDSDKDKNKDDATTAEETTEAPGNESTITTMSLAGVSLNVPAGFIEHENNEYYATYGTADKSSMIQFYYTETSLDSIKSRFDFTTAKELADKLTAEDPDTYQSLESEDTEINGHEVIKLSWQDGNGVQHYKFYIAIDETTHVELDAKATAETAAAVATAIQTLTIA